MSNTTWARYEKGGPLTNDMRRAVAKAFGWPTTWPIDGLEPDELTRLDRIELEVTRLALVAEQQAEMIAALLHLLPPDARPGGDEPPPSQP